MDETQNDAPFVAFYDMHAVTFVPPDEMADVTIAGLQWFILIPLIKPHGVAIQSIDTTVMTGERLQQGEDKNDTSLHMMCEAIETGRRVDFQRS